MVGDISVSDIDADDIFTGDGDITGTSASVKGCDCNGSVPKQLCMGRFMCSHL